MCGKSPTKCRQYIFRQIEMSYVVGNQNASNYKTRKRGVMECSKNAVWTRVNKQERKGAKTLQKQLQRDFATMQSEIDN